MTSTMLSEGATTDQLEPELQERAADVARQLRDRYDLSDALEPYRPYLATSESSPPTLHLDDISGIPYVADVSGVEEYQHRARIRAGEGDVVATVTEPAPGYESYNREYLDLGAPELVVASAGDDPLAVTGACLREEHFEHLIEWGRRSGPIRIEPFMAIEPIWELASQLGDRGIDATVQGPAPPILWIANDKLRVADLIDRLFDEQRNPESYVASEPEEMVDRLLELAETYPRVALKRTRCASAMGNKVFESARIRAAGRDDVLRDVRRFLERTNWPRGREVLLMRWLESSISPSAQCHIPPDGAGPPEVDGVYEQILEGGACVFAGSRPADLSGSLEHDMVETALAICLVFQKLGYVGRCSFDFVVAGDPDADYELRMVDCNGRWGGTSLPMQLVDRLVEGDRPPYRAQDFIHSELEGSEFSSVVDACSDHLFRTDAQEGRFLFYNVGPLEEYGKLDVISLGTTQQEAERGLEELLPSLLSLE